MSEEKSSLDKYVSKGKEDEEVTFSSRKKLFWLGVTIALLNPIFSGLIFSIVFLTEKEFKKEAKIILFISIIWGVGLLYLSNWLVSKGYLPYQF